MARRCDNVFDCFDGSDEDNCEPLEIHEKNYRKAFPPFLRSSKTEVRIALKIFKISKIDELADTFNGNVNVHLTWMDHRITFNNLEKNGNFLDRVWQDQIWLPPLVYSNTVDDVPILNGNLMRVKVLRQSEPKPNDVSIINEGNQFSGEENELFLAAKDELIFKCTFDLSRFPFDYQNCSIDLKLPIELKNYITLISNGVEYRGK